MLQVRPEPQKEGRASPHPRVPAVARRKIEVKKGEGTKGQQLRVARREGGDLDRYPGEDSNGSPGGTNRGRDEGRVTCDGSDLEQGSMGRNLLEEDDMWAMLPEEVREAGKICHEMEVEGEDRKERARGLPVIPTATLHPGLNQRCAARPE